MERKEKGQRKNWVRLDNASNIFLAAMSTRDTKVFRISAEVSETVDSALLQEALDKVYEQYLLYHSVLRRGVFWYYLEESNLKPSIGLDINPTCEALYHFDRRELLFRVVHWKKRISIEVFHVLADGTGAMWFFEDLLQEYLFLKYPDTQRLEEPFRKTLPSGQLTEDSFERYFRTKEQKKFKTATQSAFKNFGNIGKAASKVAKGYGRKAKKFLMPVAELDDGKQKVYQVKGTLTPDNRPRVVEMEMPVKQLLEEARGYGVSLTIYLTALFMEATRLSATDFKGNETIAVSVPINLRQFFPSHSARNFFSTTRLAYRYQAEKEPSIEEICQELKAQFDPQLSKDNLEKWLKRLIDFEYESIGRFAIRPLKDLILKWINMQNNRNLTLAISNLGRVKFSESIDHLIEQIYFQTIAIRPQFCAVSHGDVLTITFTSPYVETAIQQRYATMLTDKGIPVTIAVNKVTQEELGGDTR